ncbi:hypothetical protein L209DRAFT_314513 [Thermothelomyces heterothallicus CBS 203.75]
MLPLVTFLGITRAQDPPFRFLRFPCLSGTLWVQYAPRAHQLFIFLQWRNKTSFALANLQDCTSQLILWSDSRAFGEGGSLERVHRLSEQTSFHKTTQHQSRTTHAIPGACCFSSQNVGHKLCQWVGSSHPSRLAGLKGVRHDTLQVLAWAGLDYDKGSMHMPSGVTITVLGKASNIRCGMGNRFGWKLILALYSQYASPV